MSITPLRDLAPPRPALSPVVRSPYAAPPQDAVTLSAALFAAHPTEELPVESASVTSRAARIGLFAALAVTGLVGLGGCTPPTPPPPATSTSTTIPTVISHPLEPLSAEEITTAARVIKASERFTPTTTFAQMQLKEPDKATVSRFRPGQTVPREVITVLHDHPAARTTEVVVDIPSKSIKSWVEVPGAQPPLGDPDYAMAEALVANDARWIEALRKRGVTDMSKVYVDTWAMGPSSDPALKGHRLARNLVFYKGDSIYPYARPIENVQAVVDLTANRIVSVIDGPVVPIGPEGGAYDDKSVGPLRTPPNPFVVTQPGGPSYTVNGNEVSWQKWKFRMQVDSREGPVLHQVGYTDRSILHRVSLSEMAVPYGDPGSNWSWRSAFDVGEYGFGRRASPLQPGVDVPAHARFFSGYFADSKGEPYEIPRAIAVYERDGGVLWKHYDNGRSSGETRRSIELVVAFSTAVGNYDYMISYIFKMDGSMEVRADLHGIMLAKGVQPADPHAPGCTCTEHGHHVAEGVEATHHQHFFNFRLDFDVDGVQNRVVELNTRAMPPGPNNPAGNGMLSEETLLPDEQSAQRDMNLASARKWMVTSSTQKNRFGHYTGYALVPGQNSVPYLQPDNKTRQRAGFVDHHFWATQHAAGELNAAGPYPNQSTGGDGLPRWTSANRSLHNQDVVVWYTTGATHIPRPEEWPIMPGTHVSFKLIPVGFFDRNPALDIPNPAPPSTPATPAQRGK